MDEVRNRTGEVVQSFFSVSRALTEFSLRNAASLGLTLAQMGILNAIFSSSGTTLKNVAERLQLPKSSVSVAVNDLVEMDLVDRKPSDDDRREINLKTTPKGAALARKSIDNSSSYRAMEWVLAEIPEQTVQELLGLHETILSKLNEYKANT